MLILLDAEPFEAVIRGTTFLIKPLDIEERKAVYREAVQPGQLGAVTQADDIQFARVVFQKAVKGWSNWHMLKGGVKSPFDFTPENFEIALKKTDANGFNEIVSAACSSALFLETQAVLQGKS